MKKDNSITRSIYRGYLFELVIGELLEKSNFSRVDPSQEPPDRIKEARSSFIEFKGRGCWHQIDCPYDYIGSIPFSYPLRLLGEVKFHQRSLEKKYIREFIGVLKDIQENYFTMDDVPIENLYPRRMEVGVFIAANGFNDEAEKLAYAHGIKTLSCTNNHLIRSLGDQIIEFESKYLDISRLNNGGWSDFRRYFKDFSISVSYLPNRIRRPSYLAQGYEELLLKIKSQLASIQTSFIGTTSTGVFIHFLSDSPFPIELFRNSDTGSSSVYFDTNRYWLEFTRDKEARKFYFTPPLSLSKAATFGKSTVLYEKERLFRILYVNINLNRIKRTLILELDRDWLDYARIGNNR